MIQIFKIRPGSGAKPVNDFFYRDLQNLFDNFQTDKDIYLKPDDQWNIYYTVAHLKRGSRKGEDWISQNIIPFDLDGIDLNKSDNYIDLVCSTLKIDRSKTGIVSSGNGLQLLIKVKEWTDWNYKDKADPYYKAAYQKIVEACTASGLPITRDTTAWDRARLLRCPFTDNIKEGVVKKAILINGKMEIQDFSLETFTPLITVHKDHSLKKGQYGTPDHNYILKQCEFFKWLQNSPEEVHEPHAYAMLSITGLFNDDNETSKALWSNFNSPSINSKNLDEFTIQAINASGPRTCEGIDFIWGKCNTCVHFTNCTSPIQLKSEDHIATEKTGFTIVTFNANGKRSLHRCYEDLRKWYERTTKYVHIPGRKSTILEFDETHYKEVSEAHIKAIAQKKFIPLVEDDRIRVQFLNQVKAHPKTIRDESFLRAYQENKINLKNGVFCLEKMELLPHDAKYGFTKVLDYSYEPGAVCPNWDKFLMAAMKDDINLVNLLEEILAYCLSGMSYKKYQKYFLLIGTGFNGKSTYLGLLEKMLGEGNFTSHPLEDLIGEKDARASLAFSLANIVSDSSAVALKGKDITRLKAWTGNDTVTGRFLYKDGFTFINRAKFIFGFNEYPEIKTKTKGDARRIMAIPWDADFSSSDAKFYIDNLSDKLKNERSGILNKVIRAYSRLLNSGFSGSEKLAKTENTMRKNADSIFDFWTDCIEYCPDSKVSFEDLLLEYSSNSNYSAEGYPKQQRNFNKEIRATIATLPEKNLIKEGIFKFDKANKRGLCGIKIMHSNSTKNPF